MSVSENIARIREEISEAAYESGRRPEDIILLAATKTQSAEKIREAIAAGADAAGENRVQEMLSKMEAFDGIPLHFIGTLQRNKVSKIVGRVRLIHSVSSIELCAEIDKQAAKSGIIQEILLEINISQETAKSGFFPDINAIPVGNILSFKNVRLRGLMCIPAPGLPYSVCEKSFLKMADIMVDINKNICHNEKHKLDVLSMGMSSDYITAIRCGATIVRIGSAIFGKRQI